MLVFGARKQSYLIQFSHNQSIGNLSMNIVSSLILDDVSRRSCQRRELYVSFKDLGWEVRTSFARIAFLYFAVIGSNTHIFKISSVSLNYE